MRYRYVPASNRLNQEGKAREGRPLPISIP